MWIFILERQDVRNLINENGKATKHQQHPCFYSLENPFPAFHFAKG